MFHYTYTDLVEGIKKVGVKKGDIVFSHLNIGMLGFPKDAGTPEEVCRLIHKAFMEVLGEQGTLIVPTYTYSLCNHQDFDVQNTPSTVGYFTEYLRKQPDAVRSLDPIFSVAALGSQSCSLLDNIPNECFGVDSIYDRLYKKKAKICNIGVGFRYTTYIHYVEQSLNVPYRFKKIFTGYIINKEQRKKTAFIYFVRIFDNRSIPYLNRLEKEARERGVLHSALVGRGEVISIGCNEMFHLAEECLRKDPWLLISEPIPDLFEDKQIHGTINLSENASMMGIIEKLWRLPRDIVSDGYDAALYAVTDQLKSIESNRDPKPEVKIHNYPTGTEAYTWIVPEKWTCREAYLETLDGRRLFSYKDNPLHCVSYSLPFEGEVTRDALFQHLYTHPQMPDAVPYKFKFYERDWGLCCSENLKKSLNDEKYRVAIETEFRYGTLKVGEFILPGESEDSIVLCAHLCHPHMVQDDLTGVAVGVELMRRLAALPKRHYTYRFLILPETIGSLCWLSHNEHLHPMIKGGLYLEMLGLDNPAALQMSFSGNTQIDKCFRFALLEKEPNAWFAPFRKIISNDERQFNAPGIRIPMLSLSRVFKPDSGKWPYPQYHTDKDTPETVSQKRLEDSVDLAMTMLDYLEQNHVLINKFKGEVFCSRYAMHIDYFADPEGHAALFGALDLIDGTRTAADIAEKLNASFSTILRIANLLENKGLIEKGRSEND